MRYFCTTEQIALYLQKYIVYRKRKISYGLTGALRMPSSCRQSRKTATRSFSSRSPTCKSGTQARQSEDQLHACRDVSHRQQRLHRRGAVRLRPAALFSPAGIDSLLKNFPRLRQGGSARSGCGHARSRHGQGRKGCGPAPRHRGPDKGESLHDRSARRLPDGERQERGKE